MPRSLRFAAFACSSLLLAACFGDDDSGDTDTDTQTSHATAHATQTGSDTADTGETDETGSETDGTTEAPTTEYPTTEDPTTEDPTTEDPTTEDPTTEDPTTEDPTTEDPTTEDPTTGDPDVPNNPYCADAANWDAQHASLEEQIVTIVNQRRSEGANCGGEQFGSTGPLAMEPALRCAARVHSKDMAVNNYFDHTNLMGESPWDRIDMAGYGGFGSGENIAAGNGTAEATMAQWMDSPGHCSNIMNPDFNEIGVGYYPGGQYGHMWTQTFGVN